MMLCMDRIERTDAGFLKAVKDVLVCLLGKKGRLSEIAKWGSQCLLSMEIHTYSLRKWTFRCTCTLLYSSFSTMAVTRVTRGVETLLSDLEDESVKSAMQTV
jgi:hypothetical protein